MIAARILLVALAASVVPAAVGAAPLRHAPSVALVGASPASGAVALRAPTTIRLIFNAPLDPARCLVIVLSDAMSLANQAAAVAGARHDELVARLYGALRPGPYAVVWTAAALGGPLLRQSYLFTIGPPTPPYVANHRVSLRQRVDGLSVTFAAPTDRVDHQRFALTISSGGHPVTDAQVSVVGRSLDMDMGETPAVVRATGPGRFAAVGDVVMGGPWQVTVTIRRGHTTVRVVFVYQAHY